MEINLINSDKKATVSNCHEILNKLDWYIADNGYVVTPVLVGKDKIFWYMQDLVAFLANMIDGICPRKVEVKSQNSIKFRPNLEIAECLGEIFKKRVREVASRRMGVNVVGEKIDLASGIVTLIIEENEEDFDELYLPPRLFGH
jgi:hypothetical protein